MRYAAKKAAIYRIYLALLISALAFWLSGQSLSAADQGQQPQPAQTQQSLLGQTAPLVGTPSGSIFLKGTYIELGMHTLGSFGAEDPAYFADGFHPLQNIRSTFGTLGFIYNPLGWTSPTDRPTDSGDFFVPGTPEEVWGVSWNYGASNENTVRYMNAGLANPPLNSFISHLVDTSKTFTKENNFPKDISSDGSDLRSLWQGSVTHSAVVNQTPVSESLRVTQTVHFNVNDKFFVINVVLKNTGTTTIFGLKYLRSVDPDQEAGTPVNGVSGATNNYVSFQPPRGTQPAFPSDNTNKALVVAKGPTRSVTLGLGAIDSRARVAYSTTSNAYTIRDPLGVLQLGTNVDGIVMADSARANSPLLVDGAISLAFDLGDVPAGQSKVINYVYLVNESDLNVALGSLKNVSIVSPTDTVSGNNVIFQALVSDKSAVTKVDFFAGGTLLTPDTTATGAGTYETTFNTTSLQNGPLSLVAEATYADSSTSRATATVTVANPVAPTIEFSGSTPADGATVSGSAVSVGVDVAAEVPPAQVIFYRDAGDVSIVLATRTQAPFATTFSVADLANNTSVTIRVVASNAGNTASTTISRTFVSSSGSVPVVVTAPVIPLSQGDTVIYTAVSPSTAEGKVSLLAALSGNNPLVTRAFSWDSTNKSYVELPAQPVGGIQTTTGIFIATRVPLSFTLSGTASVAPANMTIPHAGWTFAGIPPVEVTTGTYATTFMWPESAVVSPAVGLTITYQSSGTVPLQLAMGGGLNSDPSTSRPWFWNGSEYVQVDTLQAGKGYWFKNNLDSEDITISVTSLATSPTLRAVAKNSASSSTFRDQGTPPPPPSGATKTASSSSGGCGVGSGLASFAFFLLLFGGRFFVARR
jgi:Bacterial Ig domain